MNNGNRCPVCNADVQKSCENGGMQIFYECPVCGRYEIGVYDDVEQINFNHLSSYLAYHCFRCSSTTEYRYHTFLDKETCDKYKNEFTQGNNTHGHPVHLDAEIIENWYPKTFSERVDNILLYINAHTPHLGQMIPFTYQEMLSVLFVDQHETGAYHLVSDNAIWRSEDDCETEAVYMLDYLVKSSYIEYSQGPSDTESVLVTLSPDGYSRVDTLQKNTSHGRSVLVAMKFGDDTTKLRGAIRKGVADAGYIAVFIDEVQHNDFITPELLKHIRDSKFVVVDLTHQNNGAYFEEGYAMGVGKPVIQLCQQDKKLHFDIAQKNTIIWNSEEDIPERLTNRIKATVD